MVYNFYYYLLQENLMAQYINDINENYQYTNENGKLLGEYIDQIYYLLDVFKIKKCELEALSSEKLKIIVDRTYLIDKWRSTGLISSFNDILALSVNQLKLILKKENVNQVTSLVNEHSIPLASLGKLSDDKLKKLININLSSAEGGALINEITVKAQERGSFNP